MGYVTWKRMLGNPRNSATINPFGRRTEYPVLTAVPTSGAYLLPTQVTTSWRTGSRLARNAEQILDERSGYGLEGLQQKEWLLSEAGSDVDVSALGDSGHEFDTTKQHIVVPRDAAITGDVGWGRFEGPLMPDPLWVNTSYQGYLQAPPPDLTWYGSDATASTRPTDPLASLSQNVAEFISSPGNALPSTPGYWNEFPRRFPGLGQEYLNWEFGFRPLGADIGKLAYSLSTATSQIAELLRRSGTVVRVGKHYPVKREVIWESTYPGVVLCAGGNSSARNAYFSNGGACSFRHTVIREDKVWFSGAWIYYVPIGKNLIDTVNRYEVYLNKIAGTRISESTLWELLPFSWLLDWKWNIGTVLSNMSASQYDSLVLKFGYLMSTTKTVNTIRLSGLRSFNGSLLPDSVTSFSTIRKRRIRATPYGFAANPSSFTGRQWAILAALGFTKAPKTLL